MKLTNADKTILQNMRIPDEDFAQIERASSKTVYEYCPKGGVSGKIGAKKAIELLGKKEFLSGLSRSAFHWSAMRETKDGGNVYFDTSAFFRG